MDRTEKRTDRRLLWVISYHHACNDGALIALVALLPILMDQLTLSFTEIGLLGFGLLITVVVQLLVGRIADRMFSRYLLEIGAGLMALSFLVIPLVTDFEGLFLAVISMRVGASFYHPVGISWITREYAGPHLDHALGVQSGIGNLGVIIAMASGGYLGEVFGWQVPCLVWAGMNLAAVAVGLAFSKAPHGTTAKSRREKAISPARTLRKIGLLTIPIATGGALYQVTSYYGPLSMTTLHGWSAGNADLIFAVWIGVGTVTSYYFGIISSRFGRDRVLVGGYLVSAASMLGIFMTAEWYLVTPILILYGAVLFVTYPALFAIVSDATDESERGMAFGIIFGFQLGGGAVVVYISGIVADAFNNPSYSFPIVAVMGLLSFVAMLVARPSGHPVK